jgi:FtsP/CotA-like multicopper oxidase with cupredoxin domain
LIIRAPDSEVVNRHVYDYDLPEHLIIASDWMHHLAEDDFPGMITRSFLTQSMLINGHGRHYNVSQKIIFFALGNIFYFHLMPQASTKSYQFSPLTVFNVERNKRYRFRFINSGINVCPFLLQIEKHDMKIIATEVSYVEPFTIDALYSQTGERFDFVLEANNTDGDYWIRVKTLSPCQVSAEGFAVLRYTSKPRVSLTISKEDPPHESTDLFTQKKLFNSPKPKVEDIPFLRLQAYDYDKSILTQDADFKFFLFLDSPTFSDDALYSNGTNYRLSCKFQFKEFNFILQIIFLRILS